MKNNNKQKIEFTGFEKILVAIALIFGILGLLIFIISIFYFKHGETYNSFKINDEKFGNFGSFISGAVGVLWSLVSVVLFYLTLRLQRKELGLQREELEMTRDELKGQKEALENANKFSELQQFDSSFFQLLNFHNQIVNAIDIRSIQDKNIINTGRDCFKSYYSNLKSKADYDNVLNRNMAEIKILDYYEKEFEKQEADLGHYFRNLYHIIKYIHYSELKEKEKRKYTNLVRAQLSSYELILLYYNCLSKYGREKFKPLVENYGLLKNINDNLILDQYACDVEYEESAFN